MNNDNAMTDTQLQEAARKFQRTHGRYSCEVDIRCMAAFARSILTDQEAEVQRLRRAAPALDRLDKLDPHPLVSRAWNDPDPSPQKPICPSDCAGDEAAVERVLNAIDGLASVEPMCRDCADEDGTCPNRQWPCDLFKPDLQTLAAAYRQKDKDLKAAREELGNNGDPCWESHKCGTTCNKCGHYIPTIEEMCGLIPDITNGLTMTEYMERLSDED